MAPSSVSRGASESIAAARGSLPPKQLRCDFLSSDERGVDPAGGCVGPRVFGLVALDELTPCGLLVARVLLAQRVELGEKGFVALTRALLPADAAAPAAVLGEGVLDGVCACGALLLADLSLDECGALAELLDLERAVELRARWRPAVLRGPRGDHTLAPFADVLECDPRGRLVGWRQGDPAREIYSNAEHGRRRARDPLSHARGAGCSRGASRWPSPSARPRVAGRGSRPTAAASPGVAGADGCGCTCRRRRAACARAASRSARARSRARVAACSPCGGSRAARPPRRRIRAGAGPRSSCCR